MADQPELDLPPSPASRAPVAAVRRRALFAGFSAKQILLGGLALAALVWGMWVTKTVLTPKEDHLVSARLSAIVGEYVQAQARSASPPDQVEAEMRTFLASITRELQRRSAGGQVVLVGEAVLTRNVPDITDSLRAAVYASGVPHPKQASSEDFQPIAQMRAPRSEPFQASPAALSAPAPTATIDPMTAVHAMPGSGIVPQPMSGQYGARVASVSNFGGPNGNAGQ